MVFETKDSGKRVDLANGMVRDTADDKPDWALIFDGPLIRRYMELLGRGAKKYNPRNWMLALKVPPDRMSYLKTRARFAESALRHFLSWFMGDRSEDHAAAVVFNINGYEAMEESGAEGDQKLGPQATLRARDGVH